MPPIDRFNPGSQAANLLNTPARPPAARAPVLPGGVASILNPGMSLFEAAQRMKGSALMTLNPGALPGALGTASPDLRALVCAASDDEQAGGPAPLDTMSSALSIADDARGAIDKAKEAGELIKARGAGRTAGSAAGAAIEGAGKAGAKAATEGLEKGGVKLAESALKVGGEGLARFVPGMDDAMAAVDVAAAAKTIADPNASVADKVTSGITAFGSLVAATNIPIVSQIGAAVSLVSSAVGTAIDALPGVFKEIGDGLKKGAEAIGHGIQHAAEDIGKGIKHAAHAVGSFFSHLFGH